MPVEGKTQHNVYRTNQTTGPGGTPTQCVLVQEGGDTVGQCFPTCFVLHTPYVFCDTIPPQPTRMLLHLFHYPCSVLVYIPLVGLLVGEADLCIEVKNTIHTPTAPVGVLVNEADGSFYVKSDNLGPDLHGLK